jgi:hypothetical protein
MANDTRARTDGEEVTEQVSHLGHLLTTEAERRLKTWDRLRILSVDMNDWLDRVLTDDARAFRTAVTSSYATNAELISPPEIEALDVAMLSRLLDHLHNAEVSLQDEIREATELLESLA